MKRQKADVFFWLSIALFILAILVGIATAGCHTISGVGRDLQTWSRPYVENTEQ